MHYLVLNGMVNEMVVSRAIYNMSHGTGNTKYGSALILDLSIKIYNIVNLNYMSPLYCIIQVCVIGYNNGGTKIQVSTILLHGK